MYLCGDPMVPGNHGDEAPVLRTSEWFAGGQHSCQASVPLKPMTIIEKVFFCNTCIAFKGTVSPDF